jgi:hypothetical protein
MSFFTGYVINLETAPAADRMITVKAILKPLASNNANAVNSKHNVSLTVTSGGSTVQLVDSEITIANPATVTSVSVSFVFFTVLMIYHFDRMIKNKTCYLDDVLIPRI